MRFVYPLYNKAAQNDKFSFSFYFDILIYEALKQAHLLRTIANRNDLYIRKYVCVFSVLYYTIGLRCAILTLPEDETQKVPALGRYGKGGIYIY